MFILYHQQIIVWICTMCTIRAMYLYSNYIIKINIRKTIVNNNYNVFLILHDSASLYMTYLVSEPHFRFDIPIKNTSPSVFYSLSLIFYFLFPILFLLSLVFYSLFNFLFFVLGFIIVIPSCLFVVIIFLLY